MTSTLLLGGPKFLGRAIADAALARGHELTFFNRGRTNPDEYPDVEKLRGDRDGDLGALEGRRWDLAIDTNGYVPRVVRTGAETLVNAIEHYTFVSSISVYADFSKPVHEESPTAELEDPESEDVAAQYGPLKAACERILTEVLEGAVLHVRAGLIVGPHDPTGRFTYWPVRVARGGDVLAPGPPDRPVQLVDARDLGDWIVRAAEQQLTGPFNATSPPFPFSHVIDACRAASGSDARPVWVSEEFLVEQGVGEWLELPLWVAANPGWEAFLRAGVTKATDAGLAFRPLDETARDTLAWAASHDEPPAGTAALGDSPRAGLAPEREAELLRLWRERAA